MRVHVGSSSIATALEPFGNSSASLDDGLVFSPRDNITTWSEVEEVLTDAFRLSQAAMIAEAPVVYVLRADAVIGRAGVLDSAVAAGLVGGARALAFEGLRKGRYATVLGIDSGEPTASLPAAVEFVLTNRSAAGQVTMLGKEHLGAMLP